MNVWAGGAELNGVGVLLAVVANFVMGGLWFGLFFSKPYRYALGKEKAPPQKPAPIFLVGPLVCGVVTTLTSAFLMKVLRIETVADALIFGVITGFGYLAATTVNTGINPNIPRPLVYGLISGSYFFLSQLAVTTILALV